MKKIFTSLCAIALVSISFGQWKEDINSGGNPAKKLPYQAIEPFADNFLVGHKLIHKKAIDFRTQKLVYSGLERYPKDANKNYEEMYWASYASAKLDTTVYHNISINYTGTNPTTYRIESWHNNNKTAVRNAVATFNGSNFKIVNYTDSNFLSGINPITYAQDSFLYKSGLVERVYMKQDTGVGMKQKTLHRFVYTTGKVTEHYTDKWNSTTSSFDKSEKITISYDANGNMDSVLSYNWLNSASKWEIGKSFDYDFNVAGKLTQHIELNNNGSGMLELKDKWEIKYNTNGTIKEMEKFDYQGNKWVSEAIRAATYNAAGDTLQKVEQKIKIGAITLVSAVWLYGDTSNTTPPAKPAAPSNLKSSVGPRAISDQAVTLTWKDNSTNEDGFKIERKKASGGTYAIIGTVAKDVITFKDTNNLEESTDYKYQVIATSLALGDSPPSNEIDVKIPKNAPSSVMELNASRASVYPNPASNKLQIVMEGSLEIKIIDMLGNERITLITEDSVEVNLSNLESGFYVLQIFTDNRMEYHRIQIIN